MSLTDGVARLRAETGVAELFAEAERQLNICNSCRFCEGYCAVYPALERRNVLTDGDVVYLANLCHDCRACLYACMYAPPHEFGVNPPAILAEVRRMSYESFTTKGALGRFRRTSLMTPRRRHLVLIDLLLGFFGVVVAVALTHGFGALVRAQIPTGSPYAVLTYRTIVGVSTGAALITLVVLISATLDYWHSTTGSLTGLFDLGAWARALRDGATLSYLRGGAEGCYVRENHASSERRALHLLVSYGFFACLLSTISAAVEEDIVGRAPPYPLLSVPVILGLVGGIGLVLGSLGLLRLKSTQDIIATDGPMTAMDRGFLLSLALLGATGLLTLVTRDRSFYGLILAVHLGVVWSAILLAPLSKFVHLVYRLLALVQDHRERAEEALALGHGAGRG